MLPFSASLRLEVSSSQREKRRNLGGIYGDAAILSVALALRTHAFDHGQGEMNDPALPRGHGLQAQRPLLGNDLVRSHLRQENQLSLAMLSVALRIQNDRGDFRLAPRPEDPVDQVFQAIQQRAAFESSAERSGPEKIYRYTFRPLPKLSRLTPACTRPHQAFAKLRDLC